MNMNDWYIGTIGFSYSDWVGVFYPVGMPSRNYLSYYSRIFNAVEIDSSFYGPPRAESVQRWKSSTDENFRFCLKTPRKITHDANLVQAGQAMELFLERARLLEEKLGVILVQFPPSFQIDRIASLEKFLAGLPRDIRFAIEVRHSSWYQVGRDAFEPDLADLLRNINIAWTMTEYPGLPNWAPVTADFLYIRWIGRHGAFSVHDRLRIDRRGNLQDWLSRIHRVEAALTGIYGFLNNDYAGFAAGTANQFKKISGLKVENFQPPQQATLF